MNLTLFMLGIGQIICWGAIYYPLAVLAQPIQAETGWSGTIVYGGFSLSLVAAALLAPTIGRLGDRFGARVMLTFGPLIGAAGLLMVAAAHHPAVYFAGWAVLAVANRLTLYDTAFLALVERAGAAARRPISVLTLYGGLASTVFWPLAHWMNGVFGWRLTLVLCAALLAFVCVPLNRLSVGPPPARTVKAPAGTPGAASPAPLAGRDRLLAFALFSLSLALSGIVVSALSMHFITLMEALGLPAGTAVTIAALMGVAQVTGRIGDIAIGRRFHPLDIGVFAAALLPLAFLCFAGGRLTAPLALAFTLTYGVSNGLVTIVRGAVPLMLFGAEGYGAMLGRISMSILFANAAAPVAVAALRDLAGPFVTLFVLGLLAAASFAAMAILWLRFRPRGDNQP